MTDDLHTLEQHLLQDPFDAEARARYARLLREQRRPGDALAQFRLVLKQRPSADAHLNAALCCKQLADAEAARTHLTAARACADFDADDARLAELGASEEPVRLRVVAGAKRDGAAALADVVSITRASKVRFSDVVGMRDLKQVLKLKIIDPFANPGLFARFKKRAGGGVMLYGPPGCGKTMMARAIATECNASFTAVGISDILNMWVGQSERNLAALFEKARSEAPAVLFFDELDALAFARNKAHSDHTRTLVNEFLNQLDGMAGQNDKLLVLAATNMPWDVDEAMKRPGRFDRQVFVPPPDLEARTEMMRVKLSDVPHDAIDFARLARRCEQFSGADIDGAIELAKDTVLSEILGGAGERPMREADLLHGIEATQPTTLDWLKTARNLVKYGGAGHGYKEVEQYLRAAALY